MILKKFINSFYSKPRSHILYWLLNMTLVHKTQSFLSILFCALMLIFTIPLGIEISLSFFLLMVILVLFNIYSENFFSITNSCINIFYILFFILAPIVQLNFRPYFLNTIPYDIYLIVLLIYCYLFSYSCSYW